jgi:hypothetical protein
MLAAEVAEVAAEAVEVAAEEVVGAAEEAGAGAHLLQRYYCLNLHRRRLLARRYKKRQCSRSLKDVSFIIILVFVA